MCLYCYKILLGLVTREELSLISGSFDTYCKIFKLFLVKDWQGEMATKQGEENIEPGWSNKFNTIYKFQI